MSSAIQKNTLALMPLTLNIAISAHSILHKWEYALMGADTDVYNACY